MIDTRPPPGSSMPQYRAVGAPFVEKHARPPPQASSEEWLGGPLDRATEKADAPGTDTAEQMLRVVRPNLRAPRMHEPFIIAGSEDPKGAKCAEAIAAVVAVVDREPGPQHGNQGTFPDKVALRSDKHRAPRWSMSTKDYAEYQATRGVEESHIIAARAAGAQPGGGIL